MSEIAQGLFILAPTAANGDSEVRDEVKLVDRVRDGDREAFGEIYKKFAPLVHGVVLARVPHDEVQDIVQDVFMTAYNNLHTLRDKSVVGAWIVGIARNRATEFYRGKSQPHAEAREIMSALRSLPDAYRETLILRLVEGMTGAEIAERTGLKPQSVRVNLHRGMEMLRQKLGVGGRK
jgi:RNA polymerase sigma-70 factor, ECF subfamily